MLSGRSHSVRSRCLVFLAAFSALICLPALVQAKLRAGAAVIDITPPKLPVLVNGSMRSRTVDRVNTRLHARAIVLDDGKKRVAIVVVDSCMVNRELLDQAKQLAATRTGIPPQQMFISATHAHSAPSAYGVLGTDTDPNYPAFLRTQLATAIQRATKNLEPAEIGCWRRSALHGCPPLDSSTRQDRP